MATFDIILYPFRPQGFKTGWSCKGERTFRSTPSLSWHFLISRSSISRAAASNAPSSRSSSGSSKQQGGRRLRVGAATSDADATATSGPISEAMAPELHGRCGAPALGADTTCGHCCDASTAARRSTSSAAAQSSAKGICDRKVCDKMEEGVADGELPMLPVPEDAWCAPLVSANKLSRSSWNSSRGMALGGLGSCLAPTARACSAKRRGAAATSPLTGLLLQAAVGLAVAHSVAARARRRACERPLAMMYGISSSV
mmetsp:Transcript_59344/g.152816  ORF Transcript_59344/g.152816 Transcript_59344/m.152816 type:complete len:257 (-) Transcript_59344:300-1070(-)